MVIGDDGWNELFNILVLNFLVFPPYSLLEALSISYDMTPRL